MIQENCQSSFYNKENVRRKTEERKKERKTSAAEM